MEFSRSRRVRAKLSHPDPKKAASPDFFHPFTSIIGHFTAFRPQNPTVVIAMCRFPTAVVFFVLFPMAMFYHIITLGTLPSSITSLLHHLPLRSSHKRAGRQEGVPRTSSLDPFLPRYAHCCI